MSSHRPTRPTIGWHMTARPPPHHAPLPAWIPTTCPGTRRLPRLCGRLGLTATAAVTGSGMLGLVIGAWGMVTGGGLTGARGPHPCLPGPWVTTVTGSVAGSVTVTETVKACRCLLTWTARCTLSLAHHLHGQGTSAVTAVTAVTGRGTTLTVMAMAGAIRVMTATRTAAIAVTTSVAMAVTTLIRVTAATWTAATGQTTICAVTAVTALTRLTVVFRTAVTGQVLICAVTAVSRATIATLTAVTG